MKLTDGDKKTILSFVLGQVASIADLEYQKRVWIRGEGPEVDDFDDACNNFFDDGDPLLENYKDFGLTEYQHQILKKFRDSFKEFTRSHYWRPEFIDTPEWARIMDLAKEVLNAFNYSEK